MRFLLIFLNQDKINMGCQCGSEKGNDSVTLYTVNSFPKKYAIGRGGFGKVWRCGFATDRHHEYAMKEMAKARIIHKKSIPSVMSEL